MTAYKPLASQAIGRGWRPSGLAKKSFNAFTVGRQHGKTMFHFINKPSDHSWLTLVKGDHEVYSMSEFTADIETKMVENSQSPEVRAITKELVDRAAAQMAKNIDKEIWDAFVISNTNNTAVFGYLSDDTPDLSVRDTPITGYATDVYGKDFEKYSWDEFGVSGMKLAHSKLIPVLNVENNATASYLSSFYGVSGDILYSRKYSDWRIPYYAKRQYSSFRMMGAVPLNMSSCGDYDIHWTNRFTKGNLQKYRNALASGVYSQADVKKAFTSPKFTSESAYTFFYFAAEEDAIMFKLELIEWSQDAALKTEAMLK